MIPRTREQIQSEIDNLYSMLCEIDPVYNINNSVRIADKFIPKLQYENQEQFWVILLDNKHAIMDEIMITKGLINRSLVHPREVFAPALEQRACAIILVHNHPSGSPEPSQQDRDITTRLIEVSKVMGIKILDHVVIGKGRYYSFADKGII